LPLVTNGSYAASKSHTSSSTSSLQEPMTLENQFRAHSTRIRLKAVVHDRRLIGCPLRRNYLDLVLKKI
jgi:hypothetical protein